MREAFRSCLSLDVLAAAAGFDNEDEYDGNEYDGDEYDEDNGIWKDCSNGIIRFLKWQNQEDVNNKACCETATVLLELSNRQDSSGSFRALAYETSLDFLE